MAITNAIRYRGFVLDCEPVKKGESSFAAQVIISRQVDLSLDEYAFHDLCVAVSVPVAVTFAKAWGRHWVDEHLQGAGKGGDLGEQVV